MLKGTHHHRSIETKSITLSEYPLIEFNLLFFKWNKRLESRLTVNRCERGWRACGEHSPSASSVMTWCAWTVSSITVLTVTFTEVWDVWSKCSLSLCHWSDVCLTTVLQKHFCWNGSRNKTNRISMSVNRFNLNVTSHLNLTLEFLSGHLNQLCFFNSINICCNYCNEQNIVTGDTKEPWLTLTCAHTHTHTGT